MDRISTVETLFDDESTRKKYQVMEKLQIMADDARNPDIDFWKQLDNFIQFGKTYCITIEEMPTQVFKPDDEVVLTFKPDDQQCPITVGETYRVIKVFDSSVAVTCDKPEYCCLCAPEQLRLKQTLRSSNENLP